MSDISTIMQAISANELEDSIILSLASQKLKLPMVKINKKRYFYYGDDSYWIVEVVGVNNLPISLEVKQKDVLDHGKFKELKVEARKQLENSALEAKKNQERLEEFRIQYRYGDYDRSFEERYE
jgi:hypothetical protein